MWNSRTRLKTKQPGNDACTLANLQAGECADIVRVECARPASAERLMAYGLVKGQSVFLVQKTPALVIRVDQTELALDEFVASCIHVQPLRIVTASAQASE